MNKLTGELEIYHFRTFVLMIFALSFKISASGILMVIFGLKKCQVAVQCLHSYKSPIHFRIYRLLHKLCKKTTSYEARYKNFAHYSQTSYVPYYFTVGNADADSREVKFLRIISNLP